MGFSNYLYEIVAHNSDEWCYVFDQDFPIFVYNIVFLLIMDTL